jgi:hypothetical protein
MKPPAPNLPPPPVPLWLAKIPLTKGLCIHVPRKRSDFAAMALKAAGQKGG